MAEKILHFAVYPILTSTARPDILKPPANGYVPANAPQAQCLLAPRFSVGKGIA